MSKVQSATLRLDPMLCKGHAMCALMASSLIDLDEWGYGAVRLEALVSKDEIHAARRAARSCPTGAISVVVDATSGGGS